MRVRYQNCLDVPIGDDFEIRKRVLAGVSRMHSTIDQELVSANLEIVRIRADLSVACEICEFQMQLR